MNYVFLMAVINTELYIFSFLMRRDVFPRVEYQNELCFSDGGLKYRIFLSLLMVRRHMNYIYILFLIVL